MYCTFCQENDVEVEHRTVEYDENCIDIVGTRTLHDPNGEAIGASLSTPTVD